MALIVTFLLGIANFAMHRAVVESGHPLLGSLGIGRVAQAPRILLAAEFAILLAAMLLVQTGHVAWGWLYALYTLANASGAWLFLGGRV